MVSYKYNILRKSLFQNSKFVDLKIVDSISSDNQLLYEFVVLDRYGNYTNGNLIYIFDEPTLKVNLNVSTSDDCKFKGSLFDIFNLELPYKQIILGPNEDTVFLFDNTKILSLNKKTKQSVLITQHKFWSKIIKCFDACDFVVLLTNMELIIVRKIEDEKGNAFLERVISIKHYFNLVKNSDLSLNAFNDDVNGVLFVFVKPLNILYIFNINSETNELSLMNNIPVSCIFAKLSKKNKKSIYLVKESLYFVSEVNGKENLQSFNLIENDVHKSNLKVIDKLIINSEVLRGNEKEEELINHHNIELKFEKEFSGRENINRYIQKNKEVNISLPSTLSESEQIDLLEEFGNNFYETLNERYGDENLYGSASMSNILPLPNEITNLAQFKDFNEQLCQSINTYTPFKIINQYDEDEKNIQKIWNNQLVLINVQNMKSKKKIVQKFKNRFKDDNFDLLKKGIDQWNPEKFKLLEIDKNYHIFNKSQSKSFNTYQSQKKTRNIISKDFEELDSINTSSQPLNSNSQKHLYSQSNIMSQWNDSSLVGSTQKQVNDKEVHLKLESDISEISGSQTTKKNKNTSKRVKKSSQQAVKKLKKPKKQKTIGGTSGFF
ncbi:hypothetical protein HANVADRAFT_50195 [Hanseniaspora valbyensis NRRL Y-1626]|uniref:Uncharacterized protein n=1 Tax=Hanseniaspora valbyensis NRRL Y-1626 TaxID=766949 RepID=A0A1B7T961_9ASCO|nr:hypothetical protein HANVADRAFT_50195 [Hanseniaspora valbyensis NRRL Y-1626]